MTETKEGSFKGRYKKSLPTPRVYTRIFDDKPISVQVDNCQMCPVNHCEFCNYEGKPISFTASDVSEIHTNGFPKFCKLKEV